MSESSLPPTFAARLKKQRENRELTQSDLARLAGLQPSAIAHFEAGRRKPSFDNVRSLAKALAISADYLLGSDTPATAFRHENKLSTRDRDVIQQMIDSMTSGKK